MSYSRRKLEFLGETLGESVTVKTVTGSYVCGGGGSSSSAAESTTNPVDKRMVVDQGLGLTLDATGKNSSISNAVTLNSTSYSLDPQVIGKALDVVASADATNGEGFSKLLNLTEKLFDAGGQILDKTTDTAMASVQAVQTARNDEKGAIDQKTMVIVAVVALSAVVVLTRK